MKCTRGIILFVFLLWSVILLGVPQSSEGKATEDEKIEQIREEAQKARRESFEKEKTKLQETIAAVSLPDDRTARMEVREVRISDNTLVSTDELLDKMPLIYNASDKPLLEAEVDSLYDLTVVKDIILNPGEPRRVSARTIRGFTQYILSVYRQHGYAGIYVYVPVDAVIDGTELRDEVLPVKVLEAKVTDVKITTYDADQNKTEEAYLKPSYVQKWSPVEVDQVASQKELDDFVNLLNLNPDRYVSAVVTSGAEEGSLAVSYDIYEASPWHWFIQADNSGTKDRQWNPRIGLINTNLLGIDDRFTAIYQAPWESGIDENYSLYGSYDFPVLGPKLRLNLYGGHSEFDINPEVGIFDFIGRGTFYGGILRYNLIQKDGWFFDIKGSLEHTRSKVTPSIFPTYLGTDIKFWLAGWGVDLHRSDDMSRTAISADWYQSLSNGRSSKEDFALARTNAEPDFSIYTIRAGHSQYLDENKVNRLSGSFRWTGSDERLVPVKMTSFGGMYTVRGYDEYEHIADGGILASAQYEFDLVKYEESLLKAQGAEPEEEAGTPFVKKLAPLVFFDYGRAKIKDPVATEKEYEELISAGAGIIFELGDNFTGSVYYGYPLADTDDTNKGKGRMNFGVLWRW
ncbi:MAG: ShlB/FhaC/HecB family hemolysin secretion/activation protein [Planctomycetota bacterium]|jgi:hemolysin activation/secretion protein